MSRAVERTPFVLDSVFDIDADSDEPLLGSNEEASFLKAWVPMTLGPCAGHWFTPQAPLDKLIESGGMGDGSGARRCDFLFSHPGGPPVVIEIDGPEHDAAVDDARDESLRSVGIDVLRVTNAEVMRGHGPMLDRIRAHCHAALTAFLPVTGEDRVASSLAFDCATAAKVQLAIARAVEYGWLTAGANWEIYISGAGSSSVAGVLDTITLLAGFDVLYAGHSLPATCTVCTEDQFSITWMYSDQGEWVVTTASKTPDNRVRIAVESATSPFHAIPREGKSDFVIRPAFLPALLATEQGFDINRRSIATKTYPEARSALRMFLHNVFRKREYRPLQGEAIFNALRQNDSVVLLPTGAGKSIIYQLAGLLMPGLTLVVDPINALIEDQVEGLRAYGIDRAVAITGANDYVERERLLRRVERGEYQFVLHSPERLQSPQFRSTLRALVECSLVNLAVIDEAHCVSEWGHDFRPAYLNLGNNLRRLGADRKDRPPPLLALTGTASRAVLRDMLTDLDIDRSRSEALVRPLSFDRPEIYLEMVQTSPREDPKAALRGVLNALPGKFGMPRTEFYRRSGVDTASGIVFVPTVRSRPYGVMDARNIAQQATGSEVTVYSGKPPWGSDSGDDSRKWDEEKRENAAAFKTNRVPVLVATKAFGMGIDKPNIRYTVHFGMPMSLESFYQEAGRAGRDRKPARSIAVFSEYDRSRSDKLLNPDLALDELVERFKEVESDREISDDVTRALWFHLQSFSGVGQEIANVEAVMDAIGDLSSSHRKELPYGDDSDKKLKEKSIYQLLKLSVIRDYEVDFGGKKFIIHVIPFDLDRCRDRLIEYVRAATPGKTKAFVRQAHEINSVGLRQAVLDLTRMLVEFTYDEIERSRRRAIMEAIQLARHASSDSEIRRRLLDYLQEGLGSERIEQLLASEEVKLSMWWELVDKVQTEMDAGELRGLCIRALESDPDHPGLLLTRALAEAMCSDHDTIVSSKGIATAIRAAVETYEISQTDIESTVDNMFDLAGTRARNLGPALTTALLDLADTRPDCAFVEPMTSDRAAELDDSRVRAVVATRRIRKVVDQVERAARHVVGEYAKRGIGEALGA
ncbi:MAG: DEAD/DEAH box helicase [Acidobacteriota bacterium]|nr:DEAD/DEAH box helicase [Acidobacteriota bacterium]